jgi:glyoxylase I family protein
MTTKILTEPHGGFAVRYQVSDVARSVTFYTEHLGFAVERNVPPAFASVTRGPLRLLLGGPGSSGSRALPDGRSQVPGGFNRIVLYVEEIEALAAALSQRGVVLRGKLESGPGGKQIQLDDPDGNPIELHQGAV